MEAAFFRIRYPDPSIRVNDTVKIDLATGKISDFIKFDTGVIAMATGGRNLGRVGVITHRERHDGGFNIVHIKDAVDNEFATRESNVFVIGREKPWISLPKGKGVKVSIIFSFTFSPHFPFCDVAVQVACLFSVSAWLRYGFAVSDTPRSCQILAGTAYCCTLLAPGLFASFIC